MKDLPAEGRDLMRREYAYTFTVVSRSGSSVGGVERAGRGDKGLLSVVLVCDVSCFIRSPRYLSKLDSLGAFIPFFYGGTSMATNTSY